MRLVKVSAIWCSPCGYLKKVIEGIEHPNKHKIEEIDSDKEENRQQCKAWDVRSLPTMLLLDDQGNILERKVGIQSAEKIIELLDKI